MKRRAAILAALAIMAAASGAMAATPTGVLTSLPPAVADRERALIDRLTIERANALAANDARWAARYGDAARRLETAEHDLRLQSSQSAEAIARVQAEKAALAERIAQQDRAYAAELAAYRELMTGIVTQASPEKRSALERYAAGDRLGAFPVLEQLTYAENAARDKAAETIAAEADARRRQANAENLRGLGAQALDMVSRGEFTIDRAIPIWEQVTKLTPDDHWAWISLGRLYEQAGRIQDEKRAFEASLPVAKDDRARAVSLASIGDTLLPLGDFAGARRAFEDALVVLRRLQQENPGVATDIDLALGTFKLANAVYRQGDTEGALTGYFQALAIADTQTEPSEWFQNFIPFCLGFITDAQIKAGDLTGARTSMERGLLVTKEALAASPNDIGDQRAYATALTHKGDVEKAEKKPRDALESYRQAGAIFERIAALDPGHQDNKYNAAIAIERIGDAQEAVGDLAGAETSWRRLVQLNEELLAVDETSLNRIHVLNGSLRRVGDLLTNQEKTIEAAVFYRRLIELSDRGLARMPGHIELLDDLYGGLDCLGRLLLNQGDYAGANAIYVRALGMSETYVRGAPNDPDVLRALGIVTRRLALTYAKLGDLNAARPLYERSVTATQTVARLKPSNEAAYEVLHAMIGRAENIGGEAAWRDLVAHMVEMDRAGILAEADKGYIETARARLAAAQGGI